MTSTIHHVWVDETSDHSRRIIHCELCASEWNMPSSVDYPKALQIAEWHARTGRAPADLFGPAEDDPDGDKSVAVTDAGHVWALTCATCLVQQLEDGTAPRRAVTLMEGYALCEEHVIEARDDAVPFSGTPMRRIGIVPQDDGGEVDVFFASEPPIRFSKQALAYGGWWIDREAAGFLLSCLEYVAATTDSRSDPERVELGARLQAELVTLIEEMDR